MGGKNSDGVLSDVWTWLISEKAHWKQDFSKSQTYRVNSLGLFNSREDFDYKSKEISKESPFQFYFLENSLLSSLLTINFSVNNIKSQDFHPMNVTSLISKKDLSKINKLGIKVLW